MKATGNANTGLKVTALIIALIFFSGTYSIGQTEKVTVHTANNGFNLSGVSAIAVTSTLDYDIMKTDLEDTIELEPWMSTFGSQSVIAAENTDTESEPELESWMTDLSKWDIQ